MSVIISVITVIVRGRVDAVSVPPFLPFVPATTRTGPR